MNVGDIDLVLYNKDTEQKNCAAKPNSQTLNHEQEMTTIRHKKQQEPVLV